MMKAFETYPEMILVDGTYCLLDSKAATYLIVVEDSEAITEIVAVCLILQENEDSVNWFIETFKKHNSSHTKINVIMSDKDRTERSVFKKHFPLASLQICLLHTLQIFNREVNTKKWELLKNSPQKVKFIFKN